MKKLKYLLILPFIFISNVHAAQVTNWMQDYTKPVNGWGYDCSAYNKCSSSAIQTDLIYFSNTSKEWQYGGFVWYATTVANSAGTIGVFASNVIFDTNTLYSVRIAVCNAQSSPKGVNISVGNNTETTTNYTYPVINYYGGYNGISGTPATYYTSQTGESYSAHDVGLKCISMFGIIQPTHDGEYLGAQFTTSTTTSNLNYVLGYTVEPLGQVNNLSSSQVQSIVNNATSDLATSSSVSSVQRSVNEVKQEISGMKEEQKKTNEELKKTNDTLNNDDVTDSTNKANEFFNGFSTDTFGLTSIITAPLELIASITSSTCSPLGLQFPFVENKTLNLPCMSSIYQQHFGSFLTIYQTITFGIIAYWVCVRIFALVKDFKNPDTDKVEVLDL